MAAIGDAYAILLWGFPVPFLGPFFERACEPDSYSEKWESLEVKPRLFSDAVRPIPSGFVQSGDSYGECRPEEHRK